MIKRLIRRVLGLPSEVRVARGQHDLTRDAISPATAKVCAALRGAGFSGYVVGGAVRDLLLGISPKDFDVATNARPEQVRPLFRRAIIIGRRFRLVHVMFGSETIEVSTFRAYDTGERDTDEHGRVLADNVFGQQHEDAARRDFTINALYYDPGTGEVLDYTEGVRDIQRRRLRIIGDPQTRYREDPVRMLRAVRFAAKLGFEIDSATRAPISRLASLIENVPAARLFDEMLKLLTSGYSVACISQLRAEGLHHGLLPLLDVILEQPQGERFVMLSLARTDERARTGKRVAPGFLFATLLWHEVLSKWNARLAAGEHRMPALEAAIDQILETQTEKLAIQRRFTSDMREIWTLQPRLERRAGQAPYRLLEHLRLRAGYDFLLIRCAAEEAPAELGEWWTKFLHGSEEQRAALMQEASTSRPAPGSRRKRRPRRKPAEAA